MKLPVTLKLILVFVCCCVVNVTLLSQIIVNNGDCELGIFIPDNQCVQVTIPITDAPGNQLGQNVFLTEVRLLLDHVWRNDLKVSLIAPDGSTEIKLINERGASGKGFGNLDVVDCTEPLVLTETDCTIDSVKNILQSTTAIGAFVPEESFSNFYLPLPFNPNGNWILEVCDEKIGDVGRLEYVELVFAPLGCPAPTELEAFNIRGKTIDLAWQNNGQCDGSVIIEYGIAGFTPGNSFAAGSANSQTVVLNCIEEFDLTNLEELTTYDIYVRQTCNPYTYYYNSCKITVQTDCVLPPTTLSENFNSQINCSGNGACVDCPTLQGVWQNDVSDDIDWIVNRGRTVTSNTGPSNDADPNGQYIYLEASDVCRPVKEAILISDCIEVGAAIGICHFSFFYHMYGNDVNTLFFEVTTDGINWTKLWEKEGNQGDEWKKQYINLSSYHGRIVQFRFRGVSPTLNFRGDIALDRLEFYGSQLKASDIFYADNDNDGFGNPNDSIAVCFTAQPNGYVANNLDCDDSNATIHPDAMEIPCNGIDENCNGMADDVLIFNTSFAVQPICGEETATITVTTANNGQIYWFDNNTAINPIDSGTTFITPILTTTTNYYYQEVKVFGGQTCKSDIVEVEVIVNTKPVISNASGNQTICQNTSFDLKNLIIQDANNATDTLLYFSNDSYTTTAQLNNTVISLSSDSVFYIQARSNSGCTDELAVSFSKQAIPTVAINASDTVEVCFQSSPQLISVSEGGTGIAPFDYNWSTGVQGKEAIIFSRTKDFYQTIEVTVTSQTNGCSATDSVVVHTLPSISSIAVTAIQEPDFCQKNGAITVVPQDGQAPYTYLWNGTTSGIANTINDTNYSLPNLEIGAYNITVSDAFGCKKALPQQFVNGVDFGINEIKDVTCFGAKDGRITINVGGLVNPTFQWKKGDSLFASTQNVAGLTGGIYSVIVDADNVAPCSIDSIIISEPPVLAVSSKKAISPSCSGRSDGAIELVITGGTPLTNGDYTFTWNNNLPNTATPQGLQPSMYAVTIEDANNCVVNETVTIEPTPALELALIGFDPNCFGEKDGEIHATVLGGTIPYSYEWNDDLNQATSTAFGLEAATYTLKVTDKNGCEEMASKTLLNPTPLSAAVATITSPLCNEISDGKIELTVNGGTGAYRYLWSNDSTTASLNEVMAGRYAVTVSDQENCTVIIDSILVNAPDLMTISFSTLTNPLCIGIDNGQIEATVNGGTAPYNYEWNNEATGKIIQNLSPDKYSVSITDANGCKAVSDTATLLAPQLITVEDFLVVDSIQCKGADNGVVFYRLKSAAPNANNFSYEWEDSTTIINDATGLWLSSNYTTLTAGAYSLKIQDNVGCILNTTFTLSEPDFLQIDTILVEAASCFGETDGNAIATITGGTAQYAYNWTLPNNRIVRTTEAVLENIDGGDYKLEVIDANNCVSPAYNFSIESSSPIQLQVNEVRGVSCSSPETGLIDLATLGGRGHLDYAWNNGLTTEDLTQLDAGTYTITITDEAECTLKQSFEIELKEDSLQIEILTIENPNCQNSNEGEVVLKVNGGFGNYDYFWNNGLQMTGGDTMRFSNLSAGVYNVSVIDENNDYLCRGYLNEINLAPNGTIAVNLDDFKNQLDCFDDTEGAFYITPSGGTAPYQYSWSNGATTQDVENLGAGNYNLTITDANNCEWTSNELFPEILAPSNPLKINSSIVTDSLCVGDDSGRIDIDFSGGNFPYTFAWNNGAITTSIQNLLPGNYSLTITDNNDCTVRFDTSIAIKVEPLQLSLLTADLGCFDDNSGFIEANVTCGVPPYKYSWNTTDTTKNLINLAQGSYAVTVTDANGTSISDATNLRSPLPLKIDTVKTNIINCEGFIELDVSGGIPNSYNFTWRNEQGLIISTTNVASNLEAGNYAVSVQDANACTVVLSDLIISNELIIDSVATSSIFNRQSNRGTLKVDTVFGGTAPYRYLWFNDDNEIIGTNATVNGVILGDYYVVISDQNDCEFRKNQSLDISDPIVELTEVEQFKLYPNPTLHSSFLDLQFTKNVDAEMVLLNSVGKKLLQFKEQNVRQIQREIDFSNYTAGLFYIKITINDYPAFGEKIFYIKN